VTAVMCLFIVNKKEKEKEKEKEIQKKRNIKSRKIDKRKKNISPHAYYNKNTCLKILDLS